MNHISLIRACRPSVTQGYPLHFGQYQASIIHQLCSDKREMGTVILM